MVREPRHMRADAAVGDADRKASAGKSLAGAVGRLAALVVGAVAFSLALCLALALVVRGGVAPGWLNRFWFAFFCVVAFVAGSLVVFRRGLAERPELLYLAVALAITALFSWSYSYRVVGWDVTSHYRNVLTFADWEGDVELTQADEEFLGLNGRMAPEDDVLAYLDAHEDAADVGTQQGQDLPRNRNVMWYVTGIEYVPYALVKRLCRRLGVSFTRSLLLLRLTGGVFYSVVTFLGMRKLREGRMLYAAVALLPTSLFLASELGYSYWLFSLCLYGFATLAGMMQGSVEVRAGTLAKMLGSLFFGMLPRVVYFPLMFLCLLVPTDRFWSVRAARVYRGLLVGAALGAFGVWLVPKLLTNFGAGDARGGAVDPAGQIAYILSHPVEYARTFARFVLPPLAMEDGGPDIEGVNLVSGFLSLEAVPGVLVNYGYLPRAHWAFAGLTGAVLAWTTLTDKDPRERTGWVAGAVALLLCACVFVLIVTGLYFDFTPVGLDQIHGVQRRYLLPMLFPLLAFVGPHALGLGGRVRAGAYNGVVLWSMATIALASWWTVCVAAMV